MDDRKKFFLGFCLIMFSLCNGQKPKLYLGTELQKISETQYNKIEKESRSEEHTSELQSLTKLVCRLLLEKKK